MTIPYNSLDKIRLYGNEYATDQTFNRMGYRLLANDLSLDAILIAHINNTLIHNSGYDHEDDLSAHGNNHLAGDTRYFLYADDVANWQSIIDDAPKNLNGFALSFFIAPSSSNPYNPATETVINLTAKLSFERFFGGILLIESPFTYLNISNVETPMTDPAGLNLKLTASGFHAIELVDCQCNTVVQHIFINENSGSSSGVFAAVHAVNCGKVQIYKAKIGM